MLQKVHWKQPCTGKYTVVMATIPGEEAGLFLSLAPGETFLCSLVTALLELGPGLGFLMTGTFDAFLAFEDVTIEMLGLMEASSPWGTAESCTDDSSKLTPFWFRAAFSELGAGFDFDFCWGEGTLLPPPILEVLEFVLGILDFLLLAVVSEDECEREPVVLIGISGFWDSEEKIRKEKVRKIITQIPWMK